MATKQSESSELAKPTVSNNVAAGVTATATAAVSDGLTSDVAFDYARKKIESDEVLREVEALGKAVAQQLDDTSIGEVRYENEYKRQRKIIEHTFNLLGQTMPFTKEFVEKVKATALDELESLKDEADEQREARGTVLSANQKEGEERRAKTAARARERAEERALDKIHAEDFRRRQHAKSAAGSSNKVAANINDNKVDMKTIPLNTPKSDISTSSGGGSAVHAASRKVIKYDVPIADFTFPHEPLQNKYLIDIRGQWNNDASQPVKAVVAANNQRLSAFITEARKQFAAQSSLSAAQKASILNGPHCSLYVDGNQIWWSGKYVDQGFDDPKLAELHPCPISSKSNIYLFCGNLAVTLPQNTSLPPLVESTRRVFAAITDGATTLETVVAALNTPKTPDYDRITQSQIWSALQELHERKQIALVVVLVNAT